MVFRETYGPNQKHNTPAQNAITRRQQEIRTAEMEFGRPCQFHAGRNSDSVSLLTPKVKLNAIHIREDGLGIKIVMKLVSKPKPRLK